MTLTYEVIFLALAAAACGGPSAAQQAAVAADGIEQTECIKKVPSDVCADAGAACVAAQRAKMDECRGAVKAKRDGGAS